MLSAYLHPEFGYFCPSRGLRRVIRLVSVLAAFGLIAGASGLAALLSDYNSIHDDASAAARLETPAEMAAALVDGAVRSTAGVKLSTAKTDVAKVEAAKSDLAKSDVAKADLAKRAEAKSGGAADGNANSANASRSGQTSAAKMACEESTWAYLDGKCVAGRLRKERSVKVVRSPAANAPDRRQETALPPRPAISIPSNPSGSAKPEIAARKPQEPVPGRNGRREPTGIDQLSRRNTHVAPNGAREAGHWYVFQPGPFTGFFNSSLFVRP